MILIIKNDNGEVIKEIELESLVGVGFVQIPNSDEMGICTIIEEAGTPQLSYASKFLEMFLNKKMNALIEHSMPAKNAFERWMK